MKKQLLLASVALMGMSAMAQDPNPDDATHSTNLTLQWYGVPTGTCADANSARSGIGVNGKFYVVMQNKGVAVFNQEGQIKTIDNANAWVSINVDDAGNVYFRNDKGGWAGPEGAGWYLSENAQFCVIDSKTDVVVKSDIPMAGGVKCRFDALPHVMGNLLEGFTEITVTANATGNIGYEFMYTDLEQESFVGQFNIGNSLKEGGFPSPANTVQTLGMAQLFAPDADGIAQKMAVLSNNHVEVTSSSLGWGNNVACYVWDEEAEGYKFDGKWFNTPNHSAIGGFCMFDYNGKSYICYPAGTTADGFPAGDGFFVMEEELLDTPQNATRDEDPEGWSEQLHKAIATKYATEGIATGNNYRGINVEPVEGEDGKFNIYFYDPAKSMQVWTLDLTDAAGINDIVADKDAAKIFGGVGAVIVDGAANAQVYTIDGALVAQGNGSIAVPAGVYVVKAGTTAAKVIVK
ncbi:MAG: hypothetical protein K2M77_07450 [Muribaculaceae bacterium]|nr:hypothetical protein [Muribaculaceae bacterium]